METIKLNLDRKVSVILLSKLLSSDETEKFFEYRGDAFTANVGEVTDTEKASVLAERIRMIAGTQNDHIEKLNKDFLWSAFIFAHGSPALIEELEKCKIPYYYMVPSSALVERMVVGSVTLHNSIAAESPMIADAIYRSHTLPIMTYQHSVGYSMEQSLGNTEYRTMVTMEDDPLSWILRNSSLGRWHESDTPKHLQ